jgi:hypothetical protein
LPLRGDRCASASSDDDDDDDDDGGDDEYNCSVDIGCFQLRPNW